MSNRSGWIAILAGLAILIYISLNTLTTSGPGSRGIPANESLPPFAAPLVLSDLVGDANVATRENHGNQAGARPACQVDDPRALNVCALVRRRPVVLAFTTDAKHCVAELDAMQLVAPRFPQVAFAAVAVRGDRDELRTLVREHGWSFPVAQDRDGAVANRYGVAVCPTVVFAHPGGRVMRTALAGEVATPRALARAVRALLVRPRAHIAGARR